MYHDQAQMLRKRLLHQYGRKPDRNTHVIAVASGKGGAGKSNVSLNFGLELQRRGYDVLVFDADMGMANLDVLIGETPVYTLHDVLQGTRPLESIVHMTHHGLALIAGGSGITELLFLSAKEIARLSEQLQRLQGFYDFIIFDLGAGLSKPSLHFIAASDVTMIVTTPEPTAITDAYAVIKAVHALEPMMNRFQLIVNRTANRQEGNATSDKIRFVSKRFLNLDIGTLGFIPEDEHIPAAVKQQIPFSVRYPDSVATRSLREMTTRFECIRVDSGGWIEEPHKEKDFGMYRFVRRVLGLWQRVHQKNPLSVK